VKTDVYAMDICHLRTVVVM